MGVRADVAGEDIAPLAVAGFFGGIFFAQFGRFADFDNLPITDEQGAIRRDLARRPVYKGGSIR
jgi:hypothetical protein